VPPPAFLAALQKKQKKEEEKRLKKFIFKAEFYLSIFWERPLSASSVTRKTR
jgi:hypothetical protein